MNNNFMTENFDITILVIDLSQIITKFSLAKLVTI